MFKMSRVGLGQEKNVKNVTGRVGSGRLVTKGSPISRVGSDRVKSFSNFTGRVESGHENFKSHGSGQAGSEGDEKLAGWLRSSPARNGPPAGRVSMTRELFSADPRVWPAHPVCESDT